MPSTFSSRTYSMPILTLLGGIVATTRPRRVALMGSGTRVEVLRDSITYSIRDQRLPVPDIHVWAGGPLTHADLLPWGQVDVLWLDAGDDVTDARHLVKLWPHLAPGCLIILPHAYRPHTGEGSMGELPATHHEQNVPPPTPLWEELRRRLANSWDLLGLPYADSTGLALLRKHYSDESTSSAPFEQALMEAGQAPVRLAPTITPPAEPGYIRPSDVCRTLSDPVTHAAYSLISTGTTTICDITDALSHYPEREVRSAVSNLTTLGMVVYKDTDLVPNPEFWDTVRVEKELPLTHLADHEFITEDKLATVASLLPQHDAFTEEVITDVCSLFTRDPAFMRRELVDYGYVSREGGRYRRQGGPQAEPDSEDELADSVASGAADGE